MTPAIVGTLIAGVLLAVGLTGIIVPVVPGSLMIVVGLLVWALTVGGPAGWLVFGIGSVLVGCGMLATYLFTGRVLKRRQIPSKSLIVGGICGVIGVFAVPVVGLPLGFALGLFGSEFLRVRNAREALSLSWAALKATGLGLLAEFALGSVAVMTWGVAAVAHWT